jgi:hypothetical protein
MSRPVLPELKAAIFQLYLNYRIACVRESEQTDDFAGLPYYEVMGIC